MYDNPDVCACGRSVLALLFYVHDKDYHSSMKDAELTPRAIVLGAFFAIVNATANMIFAFRYAGGLAQCVRVRVVFMCAGCIGEIHVCTS